MSDSVFDSADCQMPVGDVFTIAGPGHGARAIPA